jgi:hypothetical protein
VSGLGEQPGHAGVDHALVDEHVDHLVDEGRQAAQRGQLQVAHQLGLAQLEAFRHLGDRHLAALHQPRQHHEQPTQPVTATPRALPRGHDLLAISRSQSTISPRTAGGPTTSA